MLWDMPPEVQRETIQVFYGLLNMNKLHPGDIDFFEHMLLEGYDHIRDLVDQDDTPIIEVARSRGHTELAEYLEGIREFEVDYY